MLRKFGRHTAQTSYSGHLSEARYPLPPRAGEPVAPDRKELLSVSPCAERPDLDRCVTIEAGKRLD